LMLIHPGDLFLYRWRQACQQGFDVLTIAE
jgi:hypothetical protein